MLPIPDRPPVRGKDMALMISKSLNKDENTYMEGA